MDTFTHQITINGETRDIEFRPLRDDCAYSVAPYGAYQLPRGGKVWAGSLTLWKQPDGSWKTSQRTTRLNRNDYRLVGWASVITERNGSLHCSASAPR
jgi:hypothetical protein